MKSVCAATTRATASAKARSGGRGHRSSSSTHRGKDRQQTDGILVTIWACGWVACLGHGATNFKSGLTCSATEVVRRHTLSVGICLTYVMVQSSTTPSLSSTHPSSSTDLDTRLDETTQTGEPISAHIVKVEPGESAQAKVMEARIYGSPLEALCGHVWVPSRDPKKLPMCEDCTSIYEMYRMMNDGLNEQPTE